jgi:hypothetical protein
VHFEQILIPIAAHWAHLMLRIPDATERSEKRIEAAECWNEATEPDLEEAKLSGRRTPFSSNNSGRLSIVRAAVIVIRQLSPLQSEN